ncbi:MAG: phospholipid/cholesterol/gamma-HCH transport system substrate-binding protein [Planctomycetota bacterium]|jgi:phospholipid/cholesterol/gamma-HCH transport system substrate-binding protein
MSSSRLFKLGLFFLTAFGLLAYFTLFLFDQNWFGEQVTMQIEFPEANGLRVGDGVRASGMGVGRVTRMSFDPEAEPERRISVTIALEVPLTLREDYVILIGETTLLGGRNIDIRMGDPEAEAIVLSANTVLVGTVEQSPLDALSAVGDLVNENRRAVQSIIENFDAIIAGVRAGEGTIGRLLSDAELSDTVATAIDDFAGVATDARSLIGDVRDGKGTIGKLFTEEEIFTAANEAVANLRDGSADLKLILEAVQAGEGTIGRLVNDTELGDKVNQAVVDLQAMIARAVAGEGTIGRLFNDDKIAKDLEEILAQINSGEGVLGSLISSDELYANLQTAFDDIAVIVATVRNGEGTVGKLLMNEEVYDEVLAAVRLLTRSLEDYREAAPVSTFTSVLFGAF